MQKFILKILFLSLGIIVLYIPIYFILATSHLTCPMPSAHHELRLTELKFSEDFENYHNADILFIGPSTAYRSFDVREFEKRGYKVFNMGTTSQHPAQTYLLLQRYIDTIQPKFVVITVLPHSSPVESTLDFLWSDFENDKLHWEWIKLRMAISCKSWYMINTWIFNAFWHHIYNPLRVYYGRISKEDRTLVGEERVVGIEKYIRGGYVERQENLTCGMAPRKQIDIKYYPIQFDYMKRCIKLLQSRNIPYLLVEAPLQPSFYENYTNHAEWEQRLANYPYINYNERIHLNDTTDFYDTHHMNKYGVAKFDSLFVEDLSTSKFY